MECWFAVLSNRRIRRGSFRSTRQLETAVKEYIEEHNETPRPFIWTKSADEILDAIKRFCLRTSDSAH